MMKVRRAAATAMLVLLAASGISGCVNAQALFGEAGPTLPEALLKDTPYSRLVVEVHHAPGHEPCPKAMHGLTAALHALAAKNTILMAGPTPIPKQGGGYSNAELVAIHQTHSEHGPDGAGRHGHGDTAHLHILFLDGRPEGKGHAAGRTLHDHGLLVVFPDAYADAYTLDRRLKQDATCDVERVVLLHELGHAFGLVNRGIPMLHDREADRAGHSTNPDSVMYPVLRIGPDGLLLQRLPAGFDRHDIQDIRSFQALP